MRLTIYGDFNCPYSFLASQRADALLRRGVEVDWRAVEHDPRLSMMGTASTANPEVWRRELAEIRLLARPDEVVPEAPPALVSNTLAAVSAYAEAVTDGVEHDLRRALFDAIWVGGRHLSGAYDVRTIVAGITYPPDPIGPYRSAPDLAPRGFGDPSPLSTTRLLGATIAPNGVPVTTVGWVRARQWRDDWLAAGGGVVPVAVDGRGSVMAGVRGLAFLAELLTDPPAQRLPGPREAAEAPLAA